MKKLAIPFLFLLLLCACDKEESLTGQWTVEDHTPNFPFKNGMDFNSDHSFAGYGDSDSTTIEGEWTLKHHRNGDFVTIPVAPGDTLIFKIESLKFKKLKVSIAGYSFIHDYATLKKSRP